jgi:hypothetical protein
MGLSSNVTSQLSQYYQVRAGFDVEYAQYEERREVNHEASSHSFEERPHYWTRFDASPVNVGAYVQNRLDFRGMIANVGLRADYMWYGERAYELDHEFIFNNLPYNLAIFSENELSFSHLQTGPMVSKLYLSPRLGISHPITTQSKVYFNYGHFYQPPVLDQVYTVGRWPAAPSSRISRLPGRERSHTSSASRWVSGRTTWSRSPGYYKDVQNQLSMQNIVSWDADVDMQTFANNSYADIRGIEMRLQRVAGQWFSGFVSLNYAARSTGFTGFRYVFEDPLRARDQRETINQQRQEPTPSVSANMTFSTPEKLWPAHSESGDSRRLATQHQPGME